MITGEIGTACAKSFSRLRFEGLEAFADTYVLEEDRLKMLSLFGSRVSVRAIWSALLSGEGISLDEAAVRINPDESWRVAQRILPSGVLQAVCFPNLVDLTQLRNRFLVLGETKGDAENRFFLYLDRVSETPIKRDWNGWILDQALLDRRAVWLKTLGLDALSYEHDESWLERLITGFLSGKKQLEV